MDFLIRKPFQPTKLDTAPYNAVNPPTSPDRAAPNKKKYSLVVRPRDECDRYKAQNAEKKYHDVHDTKT